MAAQALSINLPALNGLLDDLELSRREFARGAGMSLGAVARLLKDGQLPMRKAHTWGQRVLQFLQRSGASPQQIHALQTPEKKLASAVDQTADAVPSTPETTGTTKEDDMVLQNESIKPHAKAHFELRADPFVDDVQCAADVFQSPSTRYARMALDDCAQHHRFIALVGRSGAGKTTLLNDLQDRITESSRSINIIRPFVLAMEETDLKGKTLKSMDIAEAIVRALDPHSSPRRSHQARSDQIYRLLQQSSRTGSRNLLVIDEAHGIPTATLVHLKRYLDLRDGHRRVLGIALIGHQSLRDRLSAANPGVIEVAQRCEIVELEPLNTDLEAYLRLKFARIGVAYEKVFAPDAPDAIRQRLITVQRSGKNHDTTSLCYPLAVNNLATRAMNAAALACAPLVDADVIARC